MSISVSNTLTFLRILLVPFFVWAVVAHAWGSALIILLAAAASDTLDGFIARRWKKQTAFGRILDPVADRLFFFTAILSLFFTLQLPLLTLLLLTRDAIAILGTAFFLLHRKHPDIQSYPVGKAITFLQALFLFLLLSSQYGLLPLFPSLPSLLVFVVFVVFCLSIVYGHIYMLRYAKL